MSVLALLALAVCGFAMSSCSGSDSDDEPDEITVNPSTISLIHSSGSSASFRIEYGGNWTISGVPDWLNVSSSSGKGNTSITITALSDNLSSSSRNCTLLVDGKDAQASVAVTQLAGLKSGLEVTVTDEIIFSDNYSSKMKFGVNADFYYAGILSASSAGWTDEKLLQVMAEDEPRAAKDGSIICARGLKESTEYLQVFVAFDSKGNRGEIIRRKFKTPSTKGTPWAYISNVTYSSEQWRWDTTIGPTATDYFMACWEGEDATLLHNYYETSEVAFFIKDYLDDLTSYVQSSTWTQPRTSDALYISTWARKNQEWGANLETFYGTIKEDKIVSKNAMMLNGASDEGIKVRSRQPSEYEALKANLKVFKL